MSVFQQQIINAAAEGALVLTANKRLSRHLVAAFDRQRQAAGNSVWKTPQIISFDGWLHRCLHDLGESWRLLEGFPARRLWERVIEQDAAGSSLELLQLAATARKAMEADQWMRAYGCQLNREQLTADQQAFMRWQADYRRQCLDHDWLDRAELPRMIYTALEAKRLPLPATVLLVGFDQRSPELEDLCRVVENLGGQVDVIQPIPASDTGAGRYSCVDQRQEVVCAARWARHLLEQGENSIGIVVPDLQNRRKEIERVFRRQIDPGAELWQQQQEAAFSLSLGAPLLEQGPVFTALEILGLGYSVSLEQASRLLRTPYLGGSQREADRRALLDRRLRSFRQQRIRLKRLAELAGQESATEYLGQIFSRLVLEFDSADVLLPGEWAGRFAQLLQAVGWPGERSLSSSEYQMVKAWQEKLLPQFAALDPVSAPLERSAAVALLKRLAGEVEFQLEAPTGPVQVVGLLESAGLEFDHLWVMGLNEESFPAAARPNPFLPVTLQVTHGMPHSSAERELEFARNVLQRLKAAAPNIVFSYAQRQGDCELRPSPLIRTLGFAEPVFAPAQDIVSRQLAEPATLNELHDPQGPALGAEIAQGGTAILRDQALCPFRAFVHFRLQCQGMEQAQPGLDPMTRGNLLHKVLEKFWRQVRELQRLLELEPTAVEQLLEVVVAEALQDYFAGRNTPAQALLELEQQRLQALAGEWLLQVEAKRPDFRVLEAEQEHVEQIGALRIRTVIDRIDQLSDGRRVILDYKTGQVKADSLLAERLLEPQLPIYAVATSESSAEAVAFAQVRRGDCKFIGVASENGLLPKVAGVAACKPAQQLELADWTQLLDHWRSQLEGLATEFVDGHAAVKPVDFETACRYCDLRAVCRIAEAVPVGNEQEVSA